MCVCVKKSQGEDRSNFSFRSKRLFNEVVVGCCVLVAQKRLFFLLFLSKMPNDINYTPKLVFLFFSLSHSKCVISVLWTDSLCFAYVGFGNKGLNPVLSFTCVHSIFNYNLLQWHLLLVPLHFSRRTLSFLFSCSCTGRDFNEIWFNSIKCQCFDFHTKKQTKNSIKNHNCTHENVVMRRNAKPSIGCDKSDSKSRDHFAFERFIEKQNWSKRDVCTIQAAIIL